MVQHQDKHQNKHQHQQQDRDRDRDREPGAWFKSDPTAATITLQQEIAMEMEVEVIPVWVEKEEKQR